MKKFITILLLCASLHSCAQKITLDSLSAIINRMQVQIATLQAYADTLSFIGATTSGTLTNRVVTITGGTTSTSSDLAIKDSIAIEALKVKIASLKATTTIQ